MISYTKAAQLRIERMLAPQPPFCASSAVSPYGVRREAPLSIDLTKLTAHAVERAEVRVAADATDLISREEELHSIPAPVLVDGTGVAETVFRRAFEIVTVLSGSGKPSMVIVSAAASLPEPIEHSTVIVETWPPRLDDLLSTFDCARRLSWGVVVPVIFPATTDLALLEQLADAARKAGARFFTAAAIELDAPSRRAVAEMMGDALGEETYEAMFHDNVETITLATERHIAALAAEREMSDFVESDVPGSRSNWAAASHLTRLGSRMVRMDEDAESGWSCIRSAAAVARLDKPLERIGEAADVSIVKSIEPDAAAALREWLRDGTSSLGAAVDRRWRLRRDYAAE